MFIFGDVTVLYYVVSSGAGHSVAGRANIFSIVLQTSAGLYGGLSRGGGGGGVGGKTGLN
jgi:hypothetical protein